MATFKDFRDGVGGNAVNSLLGIDISNLSSWAAFMEVALARRASFGGEHNDGFVRRIEGRYSTASSGERALILAILFAMDYRHFADKLTQSGRSFLSLMEDTRGAYAVAVAACLARQDHN